MAEAQAEMDFIQYYEHLMKILNTDERLRRTGVIKQTSWAVVGTAIGGAFGGPPGALVGGVAGWLLGKRPRNDYDSLVDVIRKLNDDQKKQIVSKVQELVGSTSTVALTHFTGAQANREALLNLLQTFASGVKARG